MLSVWREPRTSPKAGCVCGIETLYKHYETGRVVLGVVDGELSGVSEDSTFQELVLFPGEQVASIEFVSGDSATMTITTCYGRELCNQTRKLKSMKWDYGNRELKSVRFAGGTITGQTLCRRTEPLTPDRRNLFLEGRVRFASTVAVCLTIRKRLDAWYFFNDVDDDTKKDNTKRKDRFALTQKRLFTIRGVLASVEERQLMEPTATADIVAEYAELLALGGPTWKSLSSFFGWDGDYTSELSTLEAKFAKVERRVATLLIKEEQSQSFAVALQKENASVVCAVIQSRIELGNLDAAARLCLRTPASMERELPVHRLLLVLCKARGIYSGSTVTRAAIKCTIEKTWCPDLNTPLHVAAKNRLFYVVELLLVRYHSDPWVRESEENKRPIDLIGDLSAYEAKNNDMKRIFLLLDQCTRAREFQERMLTLIQSPEVTERALVELVPNMTAVQNFQVLVSFQTSTLEDSSFRKVLLQAFTHVIENKLVYDTDAAAYFKIVLKHCFKRGYITQHEREVWKLRTQQVNMANALWVREMKAQVQGIQMQVATLESSTRVFREQFDILHRTLLQKEKQEKEKAATLWKLKLLTLGLVTVGGSVVGDALNGILDAVYPATLLSKAAGDVGRKAIIEVVTEKYALLAVDSGLENSLKICGIDPLKFKDVLIEAAIVQNSELAVASGHPMPGANQSFGATGSAAGEAPPFVLRDATDQESQPRTSTAANGPQRQAEEVEEEDQSSAPTAQDYEAQQLGDCHLAVLNSKGDLDRFLWLWECVKNSCDVNKAQQVIVKVAATEFTRMVIPPHVFASYLGYRDIVKHLINREDFKAAGAGENAVVTMTRALDAARIT